MNSTFIYGLAEPNSDTIRYIGKANNPEDRLSKHLRPHSFKAKTHKNEWIKSLLNCGSKPVLIVIAKVAYPQWKEMEMLFIARAKKAGWSLTNGTSGGDGSLDLRHTEKAKRKMSKAHTGKILSEEQRKKMGESKRGSRNGMWEVHRYGEANPFWGKHHSFETREKISRSKRKDNPTRKALWLRKYREQKRKLLTQEEKLNGYF